MSWFMRWEQFMRTDLGLKGSELYVYAVIYGFTKSKGNFSGSLKYLEEVTGFTAVQCCNTLKSLVEKGLIDKKSIQNKKGFLQSEYKAVPIDEIVLPEKQEKPKRKTKQKTASNPSKIITECETISGVSNHITDENKSIREQMDAINDKPPDFELTAINEKPKPPKIRQPESEVLTPIAMVWQAYKQAYYERYAAYPLQNAKVMGQLKQFIAQVGQDHAAAIAVFFVSHNNSWYVQKKHDIGTLLMNAQAVAVDWQTGTQTTRQAAQWEEQHAAAMGAAEEAKRIIRQRHEQMQKTA